MKFHQVLHGYDHGHRLLATSLDLPRHVERMVAIQSDLSGQAMIPEFDGYLTGYPLVEMGLYAFARTWYAYEQPRPGCVWTHTLLIDFADLEHCDTPEVAQRLFVRPHTYPLPPDAYSTPIIASSQDSVLTRVTYPFSLAMELVEALYNGENSPVLVASSESRQYEQLVLSVWMQHWAELRRSFVFSTGSMANRTFDGRSFDLQVVPIRNVRQVARSEPRATVVGLEPPARSGDPPPWVHQAAANLAEGGPWICRPWIDKIAEELPGDRAFFSVVAFLAETALNRKPVALDLLTAIDTLFPEASMGQRVKQDVVRLSLLSNRDTVCGVDRSDLIDRLCTSPRDSTVGADTTGVIELVAELVKSSSQAATSLLRRLLQASLNSFGHSVAQSLVSSLVTVNSIGIIEELRNELPAVVALNPAICMVADAWRGTQRQQYELLDVLGQCRELAQQVRWGIVQAVLEAGAHGLANAITHTLGPDTLKVVLDWFNLSGTMMPSDLARDWRGELRAHPNVTVTWFAENHVRPRLATIALASTYISPNSDVIAEIPDFVWLDAISLNVFTESSEVMSRVYAFMLTVAFCGNRNSSAEIVQRTFERVHDTMMDRELAYEEWLWISEQIPNIGWGWNWDRAERLRRALIDRFVEFGWPLGMFPRCVSTDRNWSLLVRSCLATHKGARLLADLEEKVSVGEIVIPDVQRQILHKRQ